MPRPAVHAVALFAAVFLLTGCDMLGIESPEKAAAARDAEGRAIGGACRHAGRAIEDCYTMNKRADKAAIFAGWRDMNDYMRENKMESVPAELSGQGATKAAEASSEGKSSEPSPEKSRSKGSKS